MSTFIHGIAASENIDSSGERIIIAGLDISSLEKDGIFNFEHDAAKVADKEGKMVDMQIKIPSQIVGKILKAKKIFSEKDCEDDHQKYFWTKCGVPYLYVMGELLDDYKDSAKDVAGMFRYDQDKKNQNTRPIMNFSVEGAKIDKVGMDITRSIARKITLTAMPCNKAAIAEIVAAPQKGKNDVNSLFKTEATEIELFKFESNYSEFMKKREESLQKDVGSGGGAFIGSQLAMSEVPSWSKMTGTKQGVHAWKHPKHGTVAMDTAGGKFKVSHNGGHVGTFHTPDQAIKETHSYMSSMMGTSSGSSGAGGFSGGISKALDAGSSLGSAPSALTQSAALAKEGFATKKKSKWLARAESEYAVWEKREKFREFMKSRLPHLAMGEIDAIGKTIALKKAISRINAAGYQQEGNMHSFDNKAVSKGSDIMMASEENKKK